MKYYMKKLRKWFLYFNKKNTFNRKKHFKNFKDNENIRHMKQSMNIVLIRPPFMGLGSGPPIGLAYIQDILKKDGHNVLTWDINLELNEFAGLEDYNRDFLISENNLAVKHAYRKIDKYCSEILDLKPDIVGFSLSYSTQKYGIEMAKRLSNKVRCIVGGPQASFNEHKLLDLGYFDTVVSGYGEEGVLKSLTAKGIISENLISSKHYYPDYRGINIQNYGGRLPIVTTRGCPNRCTFCTQSHPYFYHSIESVIDQIKNNTDIVEVMYNDSNINVNSKRTEELFNELSKLKNKPFGHIFGLQIKEGFTDYIDKMAAAGIKEVRIGLESGSQRERKNMNKPRFTNDLAVDFIKELTKYKIVTWVQFIFCFPDQTEEDRKKTLNLMNRINQECNTKYIKHFWYKFVVHHGTEDFFVKQYGVHSISPQNWENRLYNSKKVKRLKEKYSKLIPQNAKIYL